ncbi:MULTISPECIES: enoyl-CoA hydratase-related protein [Thermomonospora]|uniref:Enoyl-CoA hydratase/isomerase n=1 Tax=Thermomonospora curvata (strain ATCC 19995 / DSM 43183 / JCM 3096 / KCTC 9072 / NBRC 15933 / NCIMB 10081 / Henssen B9) TaxID=471852 RepID=D1AB48_THECD|nr:MULTISPECIES: enoyl-CoA hydratase-related protein [Thermomonospora]ACY98991.1 Enoyl-CoA hydratase/isomerase [Thermomonospora curvata DSM 43183]
MAVRIEDRGHVRIVTLDRPERRNAVDGPMADRIAEVFAAFERDGRARVAVLTGAGGTFCAGNDLKAIAAGEFPVPTRQAPPMRVTRAAPAKPVIAAIEGPCFGGGLELALWCDLRVASATAEFGLLNLVHGLPSMDAGTVRLPRLIGHARALEMIVTARRVPAAEAMGWGLLNRLVEPGRALDEALRLAEAVAALPQEPMLASRRSALQQWGRPEAEAFGREVELALAALGNPG